MKNLKYAYQTNMWGLQVQFKRRNGWEEWYAKDANNMVYYLDWENILKYHVAMGFKGIELMFHMEPYVKEYFGTPGDFLAFIKDLGMEAVPAVFTVGIGAEDERKHDASLRQVKRVIDFGAALGSEVLTFMPASGYYGNGPLDEEQIANCAKFVNRVGEYAVDKGIIPCVHTEFWCALNKYDIEKYFDLVDREKVGFCLDTAQVAIMGFDPAALYEKYHSITKYLHLKDTKYINVPDEDRFKPGAEFPNDGDRWFYEPGAGLVDFPALYKLLKKHGYRGWVTIETDGTPDPLATMALSRYYIDEVLAPIYA